MRAALLGIAAAVLLGCQSHSTPQFQPATPFPLEDPVPFSNYQARLRNWVAENRVAVTQAPQREIDINSPQECGPKDATAGFLLVHGLGDSPYFFTDMADELCAAGYRVRRILLPGHGVKPGAMLTADYSEWQQVTNAHIEAMSKELEQVYLGGFSTGANLVTIASTEYDIAGLVLISPAFKSRFAVTRLAPYMTGIFPWPNVEPEYIPSRYNSVAMQGFAAYQDSVYALADKLEHHTVAVPTLMVVAEEDSVVDVDYVAEQFDTQFTSPHKGLIWYGETPPQISHVKTQSMKLPEQRISAASHMSALFKPSNPDFGINAAFGICDNGQSSDDEAKCEAGETVWYGPWGHTEEGKIHARLTYNPHFESMMKAVFSLIDSSGE